MDYSILRFFSIVMERMEENLNNSLMLVTCLTPEIGYEKAAECAKRSVRARSSLQTSSS